MPKNRVAIHRRSLHDLLSLNTHDNYSNYLIEHAVRQYQRIQNERQRDLGTVLAVCANYREGRSLAKFPFTQITLSGIDDLPNLDNQQKSLSKIIEADARISYQKHNCENINVCSRSFDLVFCKGGLHHLARPILGLYEMLRICKQAVVIIEPYDTILGRILEFFKLSSTYERNYHGNIKNRDNFVFRWTKRQLRLILNSYYIDSSYSLEITLGWGSGKCTLHRFKLIRRLSAISGYIVSFMPGCYGNTMTAIILPGFNIPPDPFRISCFDD